MTDTVLAPPARRLAYRAFMEEHVYPNERALSTDDQELIRSLQAKVKEQGLWAPFIGPEAGLLSCGYEGLGRLWPVEDIAKRAGKLLG